MTRSEMLEVMDQDYIRTARSKGVSEYSVLSTHAFRNALVSVLTVSGYIFSLLIGGSVVIEQIFALPGLGRLLVQAILARDLPVAGNHAVPRLPLRCHQCAGGHPLYNR